MSFKPIRYKRELLTWARSRGNHSTSSKRPNPMPFHVSAPSKIACYTALKEIKSEVLQHVRNMAPLQTLPGIADRISFRLKLSDKKTWISSGCLATGIPLSSPLIWMHHN